MRFCRRFCLLAQAAAFAFTARHGHAVVINEILYSPKPGGKNLEFIELYNEASEPIDLSGYHFTKGITFTFASLTFVKGTGFIVVAAAPADVVALNPEVLTTVDPKYPRVVGPFEAGKLDDAGESIALANPEGAVVAEVRYNNRGAWPAEPDKTGQSLILRAPGLDPAQAGSWRSSPQAGGTPGFANLGERIFVETSLMAEGEPWKYLKGLKAQETDPDPPSVPVESWRLAGFDDAAWLEGPAPIGFESTPQSVFNTVIDDMLERYLSVFFRKEFDVATKDGIDRLFLQLGFDDGFVAYLNGVEVARKNVRAGEEGYASRASGAGETRVGDAREKFDISAAIGDTLVAGRNVLAVQVHNLTVSSNDFGFAPSLHYQTEKVLGGFVDIPVNINELSATDPSDRWIELYNESDTPIDLSGFHLVDHQASPGKYTIPAGRVIPARGWLVFTAVELAGAGMSLSLPPGQKSLWIGLATPGLERVVDAYAFKPPEVPGLSEARYPDGKRDWILSREPTRGAANRLIVERDVVINEIMPTPYHPFGDFAEPGSMYESPEDQGEYIELYNRSDRTISLTGWSIAAGVDYEFADDAAIGPGEYLVVAKDPDWIASHYGRERSKILGPFYNLRRSTGDGGEDIYTPDVTGGFLANDGERIELLDDLGNEADAVRYADSGRWPLWADGRGSSLELIDPWMDNAEAGAWDASDESSKAEWKHYSYTGRYSGQAELKLMLLTTGIVLVDNLKVTDPANPAVANHVPFGDFEAPLTTTQVLIGGTHAWSGRTTAEARDGAGALRIVSTGRGNNRADRIEINTFTPALPANRDLVIEFDARWVCGEGILLTASFNHTMARSHPIELPQRLGSPGQENSVHARLAGKNPGPVISDVRHSPPLPGLNVPVTVTAKVSDRDGLSSVKAYWKLDGTADETALPVDLLDDGAHGDDAAGDGVFGAEVPGQAANRIVVFWVIATDGAGGESRFPFDDLARSHPLRLDPSNLLPAAARTTPPSRRLVYQHGAYVPDPVRSYRMIFSRENWAYLAGRPIMSNDLVDATFVFNDSQAYHNVGIRFGNSPWTRGSYGPTNASYRAKFGKDETFNGWRKFKMDNQRNENLMDERIAWHLLRASRSSVPGASPCYLEHLYCQPYVGQNGTLQKTAHIYDHVEVPGKPFLQKWWPGDADGVLFKVDDRFEVDDNGNRSDSIEARLISPPAAPGNNGDGSQQENYRWFFLHRTRDKFDSFSELMRMAALLDSRRTQNAEFHARLFQEVNVEQVFRTLAISINVDDWDTWGTTRGKNCFLYRPRVDGRWALIPWDKDLIFANAGGLPIVPPNHAEVARMLNSPNGRRVYHNILRQMLDSFWTPTYVSTYFSEVAKVAPASQIGAPTRAANFLTTRSATLRAALGTQQVPFDITSPAPETSQPESTIVVKGRAPYGVWLVGYQLNGQPLVLLHHEDGGIVWSATTWTTRPIDVAEGSNELMFLSFGLDGANPLAADSVKVFVGTPRFIRGDADGNNEVNVTDAVTILHHLYRGQSVASCHDRLDADDTGRVDITDAIYLVRHLFQGGPPLPPPFPEPGPDLTEDQLPGCF